MFCRTVAIQLPPLLAFRHTLTTRGLRTRLQLLNICGITNRGAKRMARYPHVSFFKCQLCTRTQESSSIYTFQLWRPSHMAFIIRNMKRYKRRRTIFSTPLSLGFHKKLIHASLIICNLSFGGFTTVKGSKILKIKISRFQPGREENPSINTGIQNFAILNQKPLRAQG